MSTKELEAKEQELEEIRASGQRLRRALEQQLEDEQEEKAGIVRERRELEIRLQEANSRELVRLDQGCDWVILAGHTSALLKISSI